MGRGVRGRLDRDGGHQAVDRPGEGAVVNAVAPDGVVEGVEHPGYRFALGVQWHPEYAVDPADPLIFRAFVLVGRHGLGGSTYSWTSEALKAPVGSVESERTLEEGVAVLAEKVQEGLAVFVTELPEPQTR